MPSFPTFGERKEAALLQDIVRPVIPWQVTTTVRTFQTVGDAFQTDLLPPAADNSVLHIDEIVIIPMRIQAPVSCGFSLELLPSDISGNTLSPMMDHQWLVTEKMPNYASGVMLSSYILENIYLSRLNYVAENYPNGRLRIRGGFSAGTTGLLAQLTFVIKYRRIPVLPTAIPPDEGGDGRD